MAQLPVYNPPISPCTSVPVSNSDTLALMPVWLEQAIYDIKRGANVSQLYDEHSISTRKRIIKEVRLVSPSFRGEDATWIG